MFYSEMLRCSTKVQGSEAIHAATLSICAVLDLYAPSSADQGSRRREPRDEHNMQSKDSPSPLSVER